MHFNKSSSQIQIQIQTKNIFSMSSSKKNKQSFQLLSSKRHSMKKSKKSQLDRFLNSSLNQGDFKKNRLSIYCSTNPEDTHSNMHSKLEASNLKKKKSTQKKSCASSKYRCLKQKEESLQNLLKQDIRLRITETGQLSQWMELLRQYKQNKPNQQKQNESIAFMREIQKIIELKEKVESRKYRLISSIM